MAKRIVILTLGTRGDVEPFAALGLALKKVGYDVRLAAPENFRGAVMRLGLDFARCGQDFRTWLTDPQKAPLFEGGFFAKYGEKKKLFSKLFSEVIEDSLKATEDANAIIFNLLTDFATDIAESKKIPALLAALQPLTQTGEFPLPGPFKARNRFFNQLTYRVLLLNRAPYSRIYNKARRKDLGLKKRHLLTMPFQVSGKPVPVIYGISPCVVKRPEDWPEHVHLTGYWFLDQEDNWVPSQELKTFIAAGEPPVYIGFGSMPLTDKATKAAMMVEALEATGLRAVIARGWGEFSPEITGDQERRIHLIDAAPHKHLFPLMRAVLHHGGAGTTAAGLRAGKPTGICPLLADQPYWGDLVHRIKVGPSPVQKNDWSVDALATLLHDLAYNPSYAENASQLANDINNEDGLGHAVHIVRMTFGGP